MTAFNLKPDFTDRDSYLGWIEMWRITYNRLSQDIRDQKHAIREGGDDAKRIQRNLHYNRRVANKMMTLLGEARLRRDRVLAMQHAIAEQNSIFPLVIPNAKNVDFSFNRGHLEFPQLPMWTLRVKGRSYYVNEVEADVAWKTKERATGSTKGVIRFPRCRVEFKTDGTARIMNFVDEMKNPS